MIYKEFYSELGKLLYAVADIDKMITQQEKKKMLQIVKNELVSNERHTDEFKTNAAFYTEIEFNFLDEQIIEPEAAFDSFLNFVEEHYNAFDDKLKEVCINVAKELAEVYRGTNKKEKKLIDDLKSKFQKLEKVKNYF